LVARERSDKSGVIGDSFVAEKPNSTLQSISASTERILLENTASWQGRITRTLSLPSAVQKRQNPPPEVLEIIADNLSKAGWSWGCVSAA